MFGTRCAVLCLAMLMMAVLLVGAGAAPQTAPPPDRNVGTAPRGEAPLAREAPVGHRQPRAADLPQLEETAADRERERKERELNRRLRICRNC
jgi:hypothetical protein